MSGADYPDTPIEPPRFRYFADDYCRPVSLQFEQTSYQTGSLAHCFKMVHNNNLKLSVQFYETEDGTLIGTRRYRKHLVKFDLNEIYTWMNDKVKSNRPLTVSLALAETMKTFVAYTMNENYHMSMNDFRVEGDFLRIKLNPYYIPNTQTSQFFFLTMDSALCGTIKLLQTGVVIVVILNDQPIPFLAFSKDLKAHMPLLEFVSTHFSKTGCTFTLKDVKRTLDFTSDNYTIASISTPIIPGVATPTTIATKKAAAATTTVVATPVTQSQSQSQSQTDSVSAAILNQLSQNSISSNSTSSTSNSSSNSKKRPRASTEPQQQQQQPNEEMFKRFRHARKPDTSGLIHDPGDGTIYIRSDPTKPDAITFATLQYYTPQIDINKKPEEIQSQYNQAFLAAQTFIINQAAAAKSLS